MRHNIARNAADSGYTKKFVGRNVAEVGRNSTAAILRATILGVDTRCNLAIARNIARNIAPCIPTLRTFARKFSCRWIFFIFSLPADNGLPVPEMPKKIGGHRLRFRDKACGKLY